MNAVVDFRGYKCVVVLRRYSNGRHALRLRDANTGELVATASVNIPDTPMAANEVAIKDWSENEGMLDALVRAGIVSLPVRTVPTGYVSAHVCTLNPDILPSSN
jgi:hypothetical protein